MRVSSLAVAVLCCTGETCASPPGHRSRFGMPKLPARRTGSTAASAASAASVSRDSSTTSAAASATSNVQAASATTSTSNKAPATSSSSAPKPPPVLQEYICQFIKDIPRPDDQGHLYVVLEDVNGKQSVNKRKDAGPGTTYHASALAKIGNAKPVHVVSHPADRALVHKASGTKYWTKEEISKAARQFTLPAGTEILVVHPDLFDRDLLENEPTWRKGADGLLMPCPHCKSNSHVRYSSWSGTDKSKAVRSIITNDAKMRMFGIGPVYACVNPAACGKAADGKKKPCRIFTPFTGVGWSSLPLKVKERYAKYITRLDDGGSALASPSLVNRLLDSKINFGETADDLSEQYERYETACHREYRLFADGRSQYVKSLSTKELLAGYQRKITDPAMTVEEKERVASSLREESWPTLATADIEKLFAPPSTDVLKLMFKKGYEMVEPHLRREYYSRMGGRFLRWDGTFNAAKM